MELLDEQNITDEQKKELRKAYNAILDFDILRKNIGNKVIYQTMDEYGRTIYREGVLEDVFDFVCVTIGGISYKLFDSTLGKLLIGIYNRGNITPIFQVDSPFLYLMNNERMEKAQQYLNSYHLTSRQQYDHYESTLHQMTKKVALVSFGNLIPGLEKGNIKTLENAYRFWVADYNKLLNSGINPNDIEGSLENAIDARQKRTAKRLGLEEYMSIRPMVSEDLEILYRVREVCSKDHSRSQLMGIVESTKNSKSAFDKIVMITEQIREIAPKYIGSNVK